MLCVIFQFFHWGDSFYTSESNVYSTKTVPLLNGLRWWLQDRMLNNSRILTSFCVVSFCDSVESWAFSSSPSPNEMTESSFTMLGWSMLQLDAWLCWVLSSWLSKDTVIKGGKNDKNYNAMLIYLNFHILALTLVQRLRRWSNAKPTLIQHLVSAGYLINWATTTNYCINFSDTLFELNHAW